MSKSDQPCFLTAEQVATALAIYDTDEQTGESIAKDMLNCVVDFTPDELDALAAYKGISVYELAKANKSMTKAAILKMLDELTADQLGEILNLLQTMSNRK